MLGYAYFDERRRRWMKGARKAADAEVRQAKLVAFAMHGGQILCPLDRHTKVLVGPDKFVKLDRNGHATGLATTKYGK